MIVARPLDFLSDLFQFNQVALLTMRGTAGCNLSWSPFPHFTSPAGRQEVEGDGTADDLLHVRANDGQLHHQPQDDPRDLDR